MILHYTPRKRPWSFLTCVACLCSACADPPAAVKNPTAAANSAGQSAAAPAPVVAQPVQPIAVPARAGEAGQRAGAGAPATPAAGSGGVVATAAGELSVDGQLYTFTFGRRGFVVDAAHGARITRFGLDKQNLLTGPDVDMLNYGSTFWPSPQARWGWPPVPELDSEAYAHKTDQDGELFESRLGMRAKVAVSKRIRALAREDSVEIVYSLSNQDTASASWAAWEITRVPAGGLSFFPTGERKVGTQLSVVDQADVTWFQHDPAKISGEGQKLSADGREGWLAHLQGRTLLIEKFPDVPVEAQAPAPDAEIALYAARGYVEIEPQGPYTALEPGEALTWTVRWIVAELPTQVPGELGSQALLDFVRQRVSEAP